MRRYGIVLWSKTKVDEEIKNGGISLHIFFEKLATKKGAGKNDGRSVERETNTGKEVENKRGLKAMMKKRKEGKEEGEQKEEKSKRRKS